MDEVVEILECLKVLHLRGRRLYVPQFSAAVAGEFSILCLSAHELLGGAASSVSILLLSSLSFLFLF